MNYLSLKASALIPDRGSDPTFSIQLTFSSRMQWETTVENAAWASN